jgi:hypothetical protein
VGVGESRAGCVIDLRRVTTFVPLSLGFPWVIQLTSTPCICSIVLSRPNIPLLAENWKLREEMRWWAADWAGPSHECGVLMDSGEICSRSADPRFVPAPQGSMGNALFVATFRQ